MVARIRGLISRLLGGVYRVLGVCSQVLDAIARISGVISLVLGAIALVLGVNSYSSVGRIQYSIVCDYSSIGHGANPVEYWALCAECWAWYSVLLDVN